MTTATDRSTTRPTTNAGDKPILPTVLRAEQVSVTYDGRLALKATGMDIPARRVVALIGPSGCGRVSDYTAVMWTDEERHGSMIEFGETSQVFGVPKDSRTEAYITGRVG
jgi:ABC-type phosphate transport system ATPase subunit